MGSDDMGNLKRKEQILRKNPNPSKRNFEWGSWLLAGVSDTDGSTITHLSRGDGYLELWVDWDHCQSSYHCRETFNLKAIHL